MALPTGSCSKTGDVQSLRGSLGLNVQLLLLVSPPEKPLHWHLPCQTCHTCHDFFETWIVFLSIERWSSIPNRLINRDVNSHYDSKYGIDDQKPYTM